MSNIQNKTYQIVNRSQSKGLNTMLSPLEISDADFSSIQNMRFSRFGVGPRLGCSIVGTHDNTATTNIKNLYVYGRADGKYIRLCAHTTFIEWYDSVNDKWHTLVSGLTSGLRPAFAPFNQTTIAAVDNKLVISNGTDNLMIWTGAVSNLSAAVSAGATSVALTAGDGQYFGDTGDGLIEGDTFNWTGRTTDTLTGVTGITSDHAIYAGVSKLPDTSTYSALPKMNILLSAMARIWGSKDDVVRLYYSEAGDVTDFTSAANYGDPGFEDLPEGEGPILNLSARSNKVIIYKERGVYGLHLETYSATTDTANKRPVRDVFAEGDDTGCCSPLGLTSNNGVDYYITTRGGLKAHDGNGGFQNITDRILPSLNKFNNNEAALGFDPNYNFIYVSTKGTDSMGRVATSNDLTIVYDRFRDAISVWKGLGFSSFAYDPSTRTMLAGSADDATVYEMNVDGVFSDELADDARVGVSCSAITKRFSFGITAKKKKFNTYYIDGYILPSATIKLIFRYNDGGVLKEVEKEISGSISNAYITQRITKLIGNIPFGEMAFGAEDSDYMLEGMNKFRVFCKLPITAHYNVEVMFYSDEGDSNGWWISNDGPSMTEVDEIDKNLLI